MGNNRYIDFNLIKKYPNKYNLTPKKIKSLKVLDWDRLKKECWFNEAIYSSDGDVVWCHIEGCELGKRMLDDDEFWIGFYEDGRIDYTFSCWGGMARYNFEEFYKVDEIENKYDMGVQVNTIKWLNKMIDEGVLGL